jgi:hypothetical protein
MKTAKEFLKEKKIWLGTKVVDMTAPEKYYDLEELMEEYATQQWISIEKRKPDYDIPVIVYCKLWGTYSAIYKYLGGNFGEWLDFNGKSVVPPKCWMPFPTPPTK